MTGRASEGRCTAMKKKLLTPILSVLLGVVLIGTAVSGPSETHAEGDRDGDGITTFSELSDWARNEIRRGYSPGGKFGYEKIFMMNEITSVKSNAGKKAEIKNLQKYLEANKEGIRYPDFVEKGYLIGSDLPKKEEKLFEEGKLQTSGSMWKPEYAAAYLPLCARYVSGEWHSYIVPLIRKFYNGNTKLVDDQVSNG